MLGKKGLVSVTFRPLSPEKIISLAAENGLETIEWGGDIHVPPADLENARRVGEKTRAAGLNCVSYGSYYRLCSPSNPVPMEQEVACAKALGADNLRVWAGPYGSEETSEELFSQCVCEARCLAERCGGEGITLSFEYHQGTLTDSADSACRLMEAIGHPNARLYWQPNQAYGRDWNLTALKRVLPYVSNLHVFAWKGDQRFPLSEGLEDWRAYLKLLREDPKIHHMQLEFVKDDAVEQFCQDCQVFLKEF